MDELVDSIAEMYMDGTIAAEIQRLLMMFLHELNTIGEVELLKREIHQMMMDLYNRGQARDLVPACDEGLPGRDWSEDAGELVPDL